MSHAHARVHATKNFVCMCVCVRKRERVNLVPFIGVSVLRFIHWYSMTVHIHFLQIFAVLVRETHLTTQSHNWLCKMFYSKLRYTHTHAYAYKTNKFSESIANTEINPNSNQDFVWRSNTHTHISKLCDIHTIIYSWKSKERRKS